MVADILDHLFILAPRTGSSGEYFPKKSAQFQLHYFGLLCFTLHILKLFTAEILGYVHPESNTKGIELTLSP